MKAHSHATHKTVLTLGGSLPGVRQPLFAFERQAHHLAQDHQAKIERVHYLEGLGWRLVGAEFSVSQMHEGETQSLGASNGLLQLAPSHVEFAAKGAESLPGLPSSASGSSVFQKRVAAGAGWAQRLESDQSVLPAPDPGSDLQTMDRIARTTINFGQGDSRHFRIHLPGGSLSSNSTVVTLYFWDAPGGPASGSGHGNGHYALKLGGSGTAWLFESNGSGGWTKRSDFRWAASTMVAGATHEVHITSGKAGRRPTILFHFDSISDDERREGCGGGFSVFAKAGRYVTDPGVRDRRSWTYLPPQPEPREAASGPMRLDVRRDLRPILQLFRTSYPATGLLLDSPFSLDFVPAPGEPFQAEWYGSMPEGTSLDLRLEDADTGLELPDRVLVLNDQQGGVIRCSLPNGARRLRARVLFHSSSDGLKSPTLTSLRFFRSATLFEDGSEPVVIGGETREAPVLLTRVLHRVEEVQEGEEKGLKLTLSARPDQEPLPLCPGEAASLSLKEGDSETSVFRGRIEASFLRSSRNSALSASPGRWKTWEVFVRSEEDRLKEAKPPRRFSWWDVEADLPMKVTDFLKALLTSHWPASMLDIPDRMERLPSGAEGVWLPEPEADLLTLMKWLSQMLLASWLVFDPSRGERGQWRLVPLKDSSSPVRARLARNSEAGRPLHWQGASEGIPLLRILEEGYEEWIQPPLASQVLVEGRSTGSPSLITQILVNIAAFPLFALPPGHPKTANPGSRDWLGTHRLLTFRDDSLSCQADVDSMAKRLYESSARGFELCRVRVPLILIDDEGQMRPLCEGDRVEVEKEEGGWEVWRVSQAERRWTMDALRWTDLELVKGSLLPGFRSRGFKGWLESGVKGLFSLGPLANLSITSSKLAAQQAGQWTLLPTLPSAPIQDLDPESESFGEFLP